MHSLALAMMCIRAETAWKHAGTIWFCEIWTGELAVKPSSGNCIFNKLSSGAINEWLHIILFLFMDIRNNIQRNLKAIWPTSQSIAVGGEYVSPTKTTVAIWISKLQP
jgi:hypothetical protein